MSSSISTAIAAIATHGSAHVHVFPSKAAIGQTLAEHVATISEQAIKERGRVLVAISGGSLPAILASGLINDDGTSTATAQRIAWDSWNVFFADERVVPLDHKDSNFKACNDVMFSKVSQSETFAQQIHSIEMGHPADVAAAYQQQVEKAMNASEGAFDLILLGMGPDGHTASLFPGHALLEEHTLLVASIDNSPKPPPKRITLTFPVINGARNVLFVAAGGSKAENLPKVIPSGAILSSGNEEARTTLQGYNYASEEELLPSARVRPTSGELHFYVDSDAASMLTPVSDL
jgi:6-phosphogluconolactonase